MAKRQLLIDMGNSRAKLLMADAGRLLTDSFFSVDYDQLDISIQRLRSQLTIERILVSSVVGKARNQYLRDSCQSITGVMVEFLQTPAGLPGLTNAYDQPKQLGIDRWLAMLGAVHDYAAPLVVVDSGTATTLDAIDETGQHLGGWILPGAVTMQRGLQENTQLMAKTIDYDGLRFGTNTADCIGLGCAAAETSAVLQFIRMTTEKLDEMPQIIVCGGGADRIIHAVGEMAIYDQWLIFKGIIEQIKQETRF